MTPMTKNMPILVCDDTGHTRRLVTDVLRSVGFNKVETCKTGDELLLLTREFRPKIVITSSRVPGISGLEYTRLIRRGFHNIPRTLSIIVMTDTPTSAFMQAAQASGVDEMLVRPFAASAVLQRVEAVIERPRRFIESFSYVGPCRRRRMLDDYDGPLRRFSDPISESGPQEWEKEENRVLVRAVVAKISELARGLSPEDRLKLRQVYAAVQDAEAFADSVQDQCMGDAARSFLRYINGIGASGGLDIEVVTTHINALQTLTVLGSNADQERRQLVLGLVAVVDKRLRAQTVTVARAGGGTRA